MSKVNSQVNKKTGKKAKPLSSTRSAKRKIIKKAKRNLKDKPLTGKQKVFCHEFVIDWNGSRAYKVAYPKISEAAARVNASRLLTKADIKKYCTDIQKDLEKLCGVSKARIINEHTKLAFSSIAHLHMTWIKRVEFEELTADQKACIAEIDTKIKIEWEYDPDTEAKKPINIEYVRIKLYDKQKALDSLAKLYGYDAPSKTELTGKDGKELLFKMTDEDLEKRIAELEKKIK